MSNVRVRFAPSPTGNLHIGGARTALFNWFFARKEQGTVILRIDDTDLERSTKESLQGILDSLNWLGLDWDEGPGKNGDFGPYLQSERQELYKGEAEKLLEEDRAYYCFCTSEELAIARETARKERKTPRYNGRCRWLTKKQRDQFQQQGREPVVRLRVPAGGSVVVNDLVRGRVTFENSNMDDLILLKSNGSPAYNFASVVDDYHMQITHVIRAEEHLSNTPKQILIANALNYTLPLYAHAPMILAPDRSKLSKRHGATSVEELKEQGYLPEALLNYLALLGWSPSEEKEILPLEEMIEEFSLEQISKAASIYDLKKISWINGHYLRESALERVMQLALPFLYKASYIKKDADEEEHAKVRRVVSIVRDRVKTLSELADAVSYFFDDEFKYDEKGVQKHFQKEGVRELLTKARLCLEGLEQFDPESIEKAYRQLSKNLNVSAARLIHPTRLAISGKIMGPGLFDIMVTLGKEKTLERLSRAINYL